MERPGGTGGVILIKGCMTFHECSLHGLLPEASPDCAEVWAEASGMCEREMSSANSTGSVARADTSAARVFTGEMLKNRDGIWV